MKNTKTIAFILLGLTWLTTVALRGLAIPVMARFEIGDPIVGFMSASAMAAILFGLGLYVALMRNIQVMQFSDEVIEELNKVTWPEKDETIEDLEKRIDAFKQFLSTRREKHIAVVSHSSYIGQMIYKKIEKEDNELKHCYPYIHKL